MEREIGFYWRNNIDYTVWFYLRQQENQEMQQKKEECKNEKR